MRIFIFCIDIHYSLYFGKDSEMLKREKPRAESYQVQGNPGQLSYYRMSDKKGVKRDPRPCLTLALFWFLSVNTSQCSYKQMFNHKR